MAHRHLRGNLRCRTRAVGLSALVLLSSGISVGGLAADSDAKEKKLPPGHPKLEHAPVTSLGHPQSGSRYKLDIDPAIRAQWKAVKLGLSTKGAKEKIEMVQIGRETRVGAYTVKVVAFAPHWISNEGVVRSASAKPTNPAVLLLMTGGKNPIEGWVFENLPEFNTFPAQPITIRLLGGIHVEK